MIDFADNPVRHLALLRRHVLQVLDRELSLYNLNQGSYKYLYGLYLNDHQSQQSLADLVGDDKAATTRTLARLEQKGLVNRSSDPNDRRASLVSLTEAGKALRPVVQTAVITASAAMTGALSENEAKVFRSLLAKASSTINS